MRGRLLERLILGALWCAALGVLGACAEDEPVSDAGQDAREDGAQIILEGEVASCDLRLEGARCRSNDVCGLCQGAGLGLAGYERVGECRWALRVAGEAFDESVRGWGGACEGRGGPLDHVTQTP
jgi:hypothetical protein